MVLDFAYPSLQIVGWSRCPGKLSLKEITCGFGFYDSSLIKEHALKTHQHAKITETTRQNERDPIFF